MAKPPLTFPLTPPQLAPVVVPTMVPSAAPIIKVEAYGRTPSATTDFLTIIRAMAEARSPGGVVVTMMPPARSKPVAPVTLITPARAKPVATAMHQLDCDASFGG